MFTSLFWIAEQYPKNPIVDAVWVLCKPLGDVLTFFLGGCEQGKGE